MAVGGHGARHLKTGSIGLAVYWHRVAATTHIVGVVVVGVVTIVGVVPAGLVDIVVVGVEESGSVAATCEGAVGRHSPTECGQRARVAETQRGGRAIHAGACTVVEPYAAQIERHINLIASVGVESVEPDFVELGVHALGPYLVHKNVGLDFVLVAAVDHKLGLRIEMLDGTLGLAVGEITYRGCRYAHCQRDKC